MELLEFVVELILGAIGFSCDVAEDLRNRDDRGRLKRPSNKYVC